MSKVKMWLPIQFFAGEGAASGGGEGAAAGGEGAGKQSAEDSAPAGVGNTSNAQGEGKAAEDAGQSLESLGVPADKAEKYRQRMRGKDTTPAGGQLKAPAPAGEGKAQGSGTDAAQEGGKTQSLRELLAQNPALNQEMQEIVRGRLAEQDASLKKVSGILDGLKGPLSVLSRNYGVEANADGSLNYEALGKAIQEDDALYEKRAEELGTDVATARKMDELERFQRETKAREQQDLEERQTRAHIQKLVQQAAELQQSIPGFDLRRELQNETFRRWTSPQIGMSVKDAYYTLHRDEIRRAENEAMARAIQERVAASIASGQARPNETGRAQGGSVTQLQSPRQTREEYQALKKRILEAAARGEKIYPT